MAYTTPKTWATGEVVTAAMLNTYLSNNDAELWSRLNARTFYIKVLHHLEALTTGDQKAMITIPAALNGANLTSAHAAVYTVSSSGTPTIQIARSRSGGAFNNMLSTAITIDAGEFSSYTAAAASAIDASYDDVLTGDRIEIDVDGAGTSVTGLDVILIFTVP